MYKLEVHPLVTEDFANAASFYENVSPETLYRFKEDVRNTYQLLKSSPLHYLLLVRNIRRIALKHFPYSIIYAVKEDAVLILAIKHHKQREYWRRRT